MTAFLHVTFIAKQRDELYHVNHDNCFHHLGTRERSKMVVLVVHIPQTHVEQVKEALFKAGAGRLSTI